jgi:hypothetical protein
MCCLPCFCCCAAAAVAAPAASRASGRAVEGAASLTERAMSSMGRGAEANATLRASPASARYSTKAAAVREKYGTQPDKKKRR